MSSFLHELVEMEGRKVENEELLADLSEGDWMLIIRPGNGSEWCKFHNVVEYHDGSKRVNVLSWDSSDKGPRMPFDYRGQWLPMNYPITCVVKVQRSEAGDV